MRDLYFLISSIFEEKRIVTTVQNGVILCFQQISYYLQYARCRMMKVFNCMSVCIVAFWSVVIVILRALSLVFMYTTGWTTLDAPPVEIDPVIQYNPNNCISRLALKVYTVATNSVSHHWWNLETGKIYAYKLMWKSQ